MIFIFDIDETLIPTISSFINMYKVDEQLFYKYIDIKNLHHFKRIFTDEGYDLFKTNVNPLRHLLLDDTRVREWIGKLIYHLTNMFGKPNTICIVSSIVPTSSVYDRIVDSISRHLPDTNFNLMDDVNFRDLLHYASEPIVTIDDSPSRLALACEFGCECCKISRPWNEFLDVYEITSPFEIQI